MKAKVVANNHFIDFLTDWNYKFYFLVGGYGSSKSYHVAEKILLHLLHLKLIFVLLPL